MHTAEQVSGAMKVVTAVADAIRELGSVPSGHLYARLLGIMTLEQYQQVIAILKRAELVSEDGFHMLRWVGPSI